MIEFSPNFSIVKPRFAKINLFSFNNSALRVSGNSTMSGRQTYVELKLKDIEKLFGRK